MTDEQIAQLVIESESVSATAAVEVRFAGAWTVQGIAGLERCLEVLSWPGARAVAVGNGRSSGQ